jgi:hypothetical protein
MGEREEEDGWDSWGVSRGSRMRRTSYVYSVAVEEFLMRAPLYFLTCCFAPRFLVQTDCRFEEEAW